jgi:hypothetical protein
MVIGMRELHYVDKNGESAGARVEIRYPGGSLAGSINVYTSETPDGSIRAQLELRFEDIPSTFIPSKSGLDFARHAFGRSGVVVAVDPPERFAPAMRFSIDIPCEASKASYRDWDGKTAIANIGRPRSAIQKVRSGRKDIVKSDDFVSSLAQIGSVRKLANDRRESKLESLSPQPDAVPDPGTR